MTTLHLAIGGRSFALGVEPADEPHIRRLGAMIDAKYQPLDPRYSHNLLIAALQLADDLHNLQSRPETSGSTDDAGAGGPATEKMRRRIGELENELELLQDALRAETIRNGELGARFDHAQAELAAAQATNSALKDELAAAAHGKNGHDRDLAGSLERFADLLENCASKLEADHKAP